ncbi:MAG TPA: tyrosine-type recombinase/integrase [Candidatus Cybelea sp.]|jgi:integrase|nr:tyrosine-type recombinase/integrase [Candidatus Cybelea sp.]
MWVAAISEGFVADHGRQRRRRRFFYGKTAAEARAARDLHLLEAGKRVPETEAAEITVTDYIKRFLAHLDVQIANEKIQPTTKRAYDQILRLYIGPNLGPHPLSQITKTDVLRFYASLRSKVSEGRVARVHIILRTMLNLAREDGILTASPLDSIRKRAPRPRRGQAEALSESQARALMLAAKGYRLGALVVLALTTGMRQGELFALRWSDVDLQRRTLYVHRSAQELDGEVSFVAPKTDKSRRRITISTVAIDSLKERQAAAKREQPSELVFPDAYGRPLLKDQFSRKEWEQIRKAAGLPGINFHRLRHTAASLLLIEGVHPKVVSEMLGHSSISFTLETYSHLLPTMQAGAADAFDRVFGPRSSEAKGT